MSKEQQKEEKDVYSTLTQPVSLELISLWTLAGVTARSVNALVLAHIAGETAFIDVCMENKHVGANVRQSARVDVCVSASSCSPWQETASGASS